MNHESQCDPLKIFRLLNKREERQNNVEKTGVFFSQILLSSSGCSVFIRVNKRLKVKGYKILLSLIALMLDNSLNLFVDF